jgi:hypothetical protein
MTYNAQTKVRYFLPFYHNFVIHKKSNFYPFLGVKVISDGVSILCLGNTMLICAYLKRWDRIITRSTFHCSTVNCAIICMTSYCNLDFKSICIIAAKNADVSSILHLAVIFFNQAWEDLVVKKFFQIELVAVCAE